MTVENKYLSAHEDTNTSMSAEDFLNKHIKTIKSALVVAAHVEEISKVLRENR